ncbi:MAG: tetratricopeptide repeat protein [Candidatus Electrothrix sp. MAN1_4]|nr:tetratricopeptide repeat protein [Candidatus Electrothrix sp. MAN1_4]
MKQNILPSMLLRVLLRRVQVALPVLILSLILSLCTQAIAGEQENVAALFEQANTSFTQGEFEQAIAQYSNIIRKHGVSASLLYNLANSYAAAGEVGLAVLNYERARHLAPGDADIQGNLEQIRKDEGLYRDEHSLPRRLAGLLGADQWLLIAGCSFLFFSCSVLLASLGGGKGGKSYHWLIAGALLIVCLLTLPLTFLRYQDWKVGVVLAEDEHLLISPFADAPVAGDIKAGRLVRTEKEHGDYVFVETETGKTGWLAKESFALVIEQMKE